MTKTNQALPKSRKYIFLLMLLPALFSFTPPGEVAKAKGDDFANQYKSKALVAILNESVEPEVGQREARPLVVVTDLLGVEHYSKIEVLNQSPYLWAVAHSDQLTPGVYMITSTSKQDLFKKTLIIQAK